MKINPADLNKMSSHELFVSAILPRPIVLVSTIGEDEVFNLAPFSFFSQLSLKPAIVALGIGWRRDGQKKDTLRNIEFSRDFVINVVTEPLLEPVNKASIEYPSDVNEFKEVGLTSVKADFVKAPMVGESPINMECKLVQIIEFGEIPTGANVVIGEVILVHIRDELWANDHIEISKLKVIGRLGGDMYCRMTDVFEMKRPNKNL